MIKHIKHVDRAISNKMGKQAEALQKHCDAFKFLSQCKLLRYMVSEFDAVCNLEGMVITRQNLQAVLRRNPDGDDIMPLKRFEYVEQNSWDIFAGHARHMHCTQAQFLKYLVIIHARQVKAVGIIKTRGAINSFFNDGTDAG